ALSVEKRQPRTFVEQYQLKDGRVINLLGEGRLINLAAAEGHPAAVMDMSFANQALSVEWIVREAKRLEPRVYEVPEDIDGEVAKLKLAAMGVDLDRLTEEQRAYITQWQHGT
ncbi:MAG TPA: adenosylhomocysteinase, partial [Actinomycetota bacterium]|nr:adenosylhomocysteinase [Actinomycetota bacterium]